MRTFVNLIYIFLIPIFIVVLPSPFKRATRPKCYTNINTYYIKHTFASTHIYFPLVLQTTIYAVLLTLPETLAHTILEIYYITKEYKSKNQVIKGDNIFFIIFERRYAASSKFLWQLGHQANTIGGADISRHLAE